MPSIGRIGVQDWCGRLRTIAIDMYGRSICTSMSLKRTRTAPKCGISIWDMRSRSKVRLLYFHNSIPIVSLQFKVFSGDTIRQTQSAQLATCGLDSYPALQSRAKLDGCNVPTRPNLTRNSSMPPARLVFSSYDDAIYSLFPVAPRQLGRATTSWEWNAS